jgi:hypothetical protein
MNRNSGSANNYNGQPPTGAAGEMRTRFVRPPAGGGSDSSQSSSRNYL